MGGDERFTGTVEFGSHHRWRMSNHSRQALTIWLGGRRAEWVVPVNRSSKHLFVAKKNPRQSRPDPAKNATSRVRAL